MTTSLWQRLSAARRFGRKTQSDIAAACTADLGGSLTRNAVSLWESSNPETRTTPNLEQLRVVAQETGVDLLWLVTDGENLDPKPISNGDDTKDHPSPLTTQRIEIRGFATMGPDGFWPFFGSAGGAFIEWAAFQKDVYAVEIRSDLYHPEIRRGQIMTFSPSKNPSSGEYVLVQRKWIDGRDPPGKGTFGIFEYLWEDADTVYLGIPKTGDRLAIAISEIVKVDGWTGTAPASAKQNPASST